MKIKIPAEDVNASVPFPIGWSKVVITEATSGPAAKGDSINHVPTFKLEADERTVRTWFNTKLIRMMNPFLAAIMGVPLAQFVEKYGKEGVPEFEFEDVKGKKLQIKVEKEIDNNGKERLNVVDYAFYDYKVPF